jgi:DNA-binding response OmpR family regulator
MYHCDTAILGAPAVGPSSSRVPVVLIVDDDHVVAKTFERVLTLTGFHVLTAGNAADALGTLDALRPDAVILDMGMPLVNGLGLLYRIRSLEAHQYLPAIVLTGQNPLPDETLNEFNLLGAHVRYKPIRASELIETVRELLAPA